MLWLTRAERFLDAMGDIRAEWVEDAEQTGKAVPVWLKWGSIAICFCCVLLLGMVGLFHFTVTTESSTAKQPQNSVAVSGPVTSSPDVSPGVETGSQQGQNTSSREEAAMSSPVVSEAEETPVVSGIQPSAAPEPTEGTGDRTVETSMLFPNAPNRVSSLTEAASYNKETAQLFTDNVYGLVLEVPEEFSMEVDSDQTATFQLYDQASRNVLGTDNQGGVVWEIWVMTLSDFYAQYGISLEEWPTDKIDALTTVLGRDADYVYLLATPSDVQYAPDVAESANSYYWHRLYGYTMLLDFLDRNGIEPNPNWDTDYLKTLRSLSFGSGDFYQVEFGLGSTSSQEPLLTEAAAAIPNLSAYFAGPEETRETLSWEDLLLYRLLQTDFSAVTEAPVAFGEELHEKLVSFTTERIAYLDPDANYAQEIAMFIRLLHTLCEMPDPDAVCETTDWYVTADGSGWVLYASQTDGTSQILAEAAAEDPIWN